MNDTERNEKKESLNNLLLKFQFQLDDLYSLSPGSLDRGILQDIRSHINHIQNDVNSLFSQTIEEKKSLHIGSRRQ